MKTNAKYTLTLTERGNIDALVAAARQRMAADAQLTENAAQRAEGVKMEKWWSVVAGITLVVSFILYTAYLTIPAVILICLLALFLVYVGITMRLRGKKLERVEHEISPQRSADAVLRYAAGLPADPRMLAYCDMTSLDAFSAALKAQLSDIAAAEGVSPVPANFTTAVDVTFLENIGDDRAAMAVSALCTLENNTAVAINYKATFALAATGDCILADVEPGVCREG